MTMIQVLFYIMGSITLASATFVAASHNLVRSIFMFFVTLLALAGLYVIALADFVAITQIVIYVGGILVLILFAFMLSAKETLSALQENNKGALRIKNLPALLLAAVFFIVLANMVVKSNVNALPWIQNSIKANNVISVNDDTTNSIGVNLMTGYLLPFEAISILLLMALVGAAHLSRKEAAE
jgi:NADH:ubiquinone oxidoreductase subunit 6 (subunit J)